MNRLPAIVGIFGLGLAIGVSPTTAAAGTFECPSVINGSTSVGGADLSGMVSDYMACHRAAAVPSHWKHRAVKVHAVEARIAPSPAKSPVVVAGNLFSLAPHGNANSDSAECSGPKANLLCPGFQLVGFSY